jgi:hypothetical protein
LDFLINPIGKHSYGVFWIGWIIRENMDPEVMRAAHIGGHGEIHGQGGAFTGLDCRRTDDRARRSTALLDFNIRLLNKSQGFIASVGQREGSGDRLSHSHLSKVNNFLVDAQARSDFTEACPWLPDWLA